MKKGYLRNVVNESYTTGTGKGLPWKTNPAARYIKIDLMSTYAEEIDKEEAMKWTRGLLKRVFGIISMLKRRQVESLVVRTLRLIRQLSRQVKSYQAREVVALFIQFQYNRNNELPRRIYQGVYQEVLLR